MRILVRCEAGGPGIVSNVPPKIFELIVAADQMVKAILLPESPVTPQYSVDLSRRKVLPGFTLAEHTRFVGKCRHHMKMVGHDDEIRQLVPINVEVLQAVGDNLRQVWITQAQLPWHSSR